MKRYCEDCKKIVQVAVYSKYASPELIVCEVCGQFCDNVVPWYHWVRSGIKNSVFFFRKGKLWILD